MRRTLTVGLIVVTLIAGVLAVARRREKEGKRRARPVIRLVSIASRAMPALKPWMQKTLINAGYQAVNIWGKQLDGAFLNYGYAPLDVDRLPIELTEREERTRNGVQLYYVLAKEVSLQGKDVLEVGCGRGGGAAFLHRYFRPASLTAVDLSSRAIAYCNSRHSGDGLRFLEGDAEQLPFPDCSFDVVVNVESSHSYPRIERFFQEVHRVLRPGGYLLLTDMRRAEHVTELRAQILSAGFTILEEECVTPNVARALVLEKELRRGVLERHVPRLLRPAMSDFLAVDGSAIYDGFQHRSLEYVRFVTRVV